MSRRIDQPPFRIHWLLWAMIILGAVGMGGSLFVLAYAFKGIWQ